MKTDLKSVSGEPRFRTRLESLLFPQWDMSLRLKGSGYFHNVHTVRVVLHVMVYLFPPCLCVQQDFLYIFLSSLSGHTDLYAAQAGDTNTGSRTDPKGHEQWIQDVQQGVNLYVCLCPGMSGVSTLRPRQLIMFLVPPGNHISISLSINLKMSIKNNY